ncbi:C-X-C motif chemokine 11-6-like [Pseudophryne corroboree]|uniref:C-X-C motif chemokine 11-6-like n=1 Tax=Pseudophryne corroboree TaxID=495146 RepID=UPI0030818364
MDRTVIIVFCSLLFLQSYVQGMSPLGRRRCLCMGRGVSSVEMKQVKKIVVFPPSAKCEKMEVVVHLKNGAEKCLSSSSKLMKSIMTKVKK